MKRTIVVFGAILGDAELPGRNHVRAVTRDPNSQAAKGLRNRGVEVTIADMNLPGTVERASIDTCHYLDQYMLILCGNGSAPPHDKPFNCNATISPFSIIG